MPLHVQTDRVVKDSGLRMMYEQEKGEKGQTRINLDELVTATRQFSYNEEDEDLMPLRAFSPMRRWRPGKVRPIPGRMRYS
jgi:DNA helicase-2/ATP-dependent DNA helicase PcrA